MAVVRIMVYRRSRSDVHGLRTVHTVPASQTVLPVKLIPCWKVRSQYPIKRESEQATYTTLSPDGDRVHGPAQSKRSNERDEQGLHVCFEALAVGVAVLYAVREKPSKRNPQSHCSLSAIRPRYLPDRKKLEGPEASNEL